MEREFNKKAGFTKEHDRLPRYMSREAIAPHNVTFDISDDQLDTLYNW
jgi:aldehyde:ferredoxin oxidoreductase